MNFKQTSSGSALGKENWLFTEMGVKKENLKMNWYFRVPIARNEIVKIRDCISFGLQYVAGKVDKRFVFEYSNVLGLYWKLL